MSPCVNPARPVYFPDLLDSFLIKKGLLWIQTTDECCLTSTVAPTVSQAGSDRTRGTIRVIGPGFLMGPGLVRGWDRNVAESRGASSGPGSSSRPSPAALRFDVSPDFLVAYLHRSHSSPTAHFPGRSEEAGVQPHGGFDPRQRFRKSSGRRLPGLF